MTLSASSTMNVHLQQTRLTELVDGSMRRAFSLLRQEEGRPSRWKDGLARSLIHCLILDG